VHVTVYIHSSTKCELTTSSLGPLKLIEDTLKKADRKALAKDKERNFDFLLFQKKDPLELDQILMDIKDIVRGTLVFETYPCMEKGQNNVAAATLPKEETAGARSDLDGYQGYRSRDSRVRKVSLHGKRPK
jgi:hypothetical protein